MTLNRTGQYVEFTLVQPANAVDLRYSIPDSADGSGRATSLHVLVNGKSAPDLSLTSKYTWFYGVYPFTNNPSDSDGHHMYDDARTMFGRTLPAGHAGQEVTTYGPNPAHPSPTPARKSLAWPILFPRVQRHK